MELIHLSGELLALLFVVAVVAGCLDTLVGGGGLICLPALVMVGLPPLYALGTNKLQGTMGTATASFMMLKHGKVTWSDARVLMLWAFAGSALGSIVVQFLDVTQLRVAIPLVLVVVAGYFLLSGWLAEHLPPVRLAPGYYQRTVVPAIGFYDGMFGPGTGSFFSMSAVALRGLPVLAATALAKTLNFATNFASLLVFVVSGHFVWQAGLVMMAGQMIGAFIGSHILFRINPLLLKALIVLICLAMLGRYFITG
ncbi:MAG TPA: TSUP family transporter [Candidatus Acidoferrum sp.]|nr:TSUP family transporter [Candidatus Acidoferrum sp.]